MHTHLSLFTDGRNAFFDADDTYFLSTSARRSSPASCATRAS
jgi:glutamine synthetase